MDVSQWKQFQKDPVAYLGTRTVRIPDDKAGDKRESTPGKLIIGSETMDTLRYAARYNVRDLYFRDTGDTGLDVAFAAPPAPSGFFGLFQSAPVTQKVRAYFLPWSTGKGYHLTLHATADIDFFATAPLNGCCLYANGLARKPVIVHSNYDSERLTVAFDPSQTVEQQFAATAIHQMKAYTKFYGKLETALATQLGAWSRDTPATQFGPAQYLHLGGSQARVFGFNRDGEWTLYYNLERVTMQGNRISARTGITGELWPNFQPVV
ncbi:hypothetical protein [Corallococcus terminator]|uniref:Uncharacterized protein n=1 Tax=Corallococcus terminator TaxID=2316733 RepID=A0A3A8J1L5_9BACT|nr:hypothetical protein [Corallococcus terminator]RKG83443.1 hypothetical protein D7V88_24080 [Corallococcus terminator]